MVMTMRKKFSKLRYRLLLAILAFVFVPLALLTAFAQTRVYSLTEKQAISLNDNLAEAGMERLELTYKQINSVYRSIYLNDSFKNYLKLRQYTLSKPEAAALEQQMASAFLSSLSSRQDLFSMIYIDNNGTLFYSSQDEAGVYSDYRSCGLPEDYISLFEHADAWKESLRMLPTDTHMPLRHTGESSPLVYAAARRILNTENRFSPTGVMFITVRLSEVEQIAELMKTDAASLVYLTAENGRVVYSSDGTLTGGTLPEELLSSFPPPGGQGKIVLGEERYVALSSRESSFGWRFICLTPDSIYRNDAVSVSSVIILVAVLMLIVGSVAAASLSAQISRPVESLASSMEQIELTNLDERVEVHGPEEICRLGFSFNGLLDRLEESLQNEYLMELEQKDATLRALQAQTDPHFLYNTLQSISSMATVYGTPEIGTMSNALGALLRYSISGESLTATVREEIEHVRSYLVIQKLRFGQSVDYVIDIPEYMMDRELPRITLLPLVENAFSHGFEQSGEVRTVLITGRLEGDATVIEVSDNGSGITSERLGEIRARLSAPVTAQQSSPGMGLINLNSRLRLLYGETASLRIDSDLDVGTSVELVIPPEGGGRP